MGTKNKMLCIILYLDKDRKGETDNFYIIGRDISAYLQTEGKFHLTVSSSAVSPLCLIFRDRMVSSANVSFCQHVSLNLSHELTTSSCVFSWNVTLGSMVIAK